jgi:amino acid adenylation domain-containing protein
MAEDSEIYRAHDVLNALARARRQLTEVQETAREPIAIVGMACRLGGGIDSPEAFAELLFSGRDAVEPVPASRWDASALFHPDPEHPGTSVSRHGSFVRDIDRFDAEFFAISRREARYMDPQQRMLLELSWQALEHATVPPLSLSGAPVGVFVGLTTNDYARLNGTHGAAQDVERYSGTGSAACVAAGRIAHGLGLRGPTLTVDTACSSSLVAVHLACRSLRDRECELALVGGASALLYPNAQVYLSQIRALSPRGVCNTFDARADGYVRGEGCVVLALERLSVARAKGHRVWAVVRASAVNHDGRSSGLTVPNGPAQTAVVRAALAAGGIAPHEVSYVEAHGTGTPLGDPIEVSALAEALDRTSVERPPLWLGSVKTNLGHLEAAAGITGLLKVVLAIGAGRIPAHLHLEQPSQHIPWDTLPIRVPQRAEPWSGPRIAGVSAFGFSGTNAHVLVAEQLDAPRAEAVEAASPAVLCLSARSLPALERLLGQYVERLQADPGLRWDDLAYTAAVGRSHFVERVAVLARDRHDALTQLRARRSIAPAQALRAGGVAFYLHDSSDPGAHEALAAFPPFRAAFAACEVAVQRLGLGPIAAGASDAASRLATQFAFASLYAAWGLRPLAVIAGAGAEKCAAVLAEQWSLEEAFASLLPQSSGQSLRAPALAVVCPVSGELLQASRSEQLHAREGDAAEPLLARLERLGIGVVLELGRRDVRSDPWAAKFSGAGRCWLQLEAPADADALWRSVAALYERGVELDFAAVFAGRPGRRVVLPRYPFERTSHWIDLSGEPAPLTQARTSEPSAAAPSVLEPRWQLAPVCEATLRGRWLILGEDPLVDELLAASSLFRRVETLVGQALEGCAGVLIAPGPVQEQALIDAASRLSAGVALWVVTRGAQSVDGDPAGEPACAEAALLWGLGRGIALERPECWGGCVDLPPRSNHAPGEAQRLLAALAGDDGEDQLALRGDQRWVLRLHERASEPDASRLALRADASYLITGGLGSIGLRLARWLADRGARELILSSLRPPRMHSEFATMARDRQLCERLEAIAGLERVGVRVRLLHVDVADRAALESELARCEREGPPIRGVFHLAGQRDEGPLETLDAARFEQVCRAKVRGAQNLDRWSEGRELDLFVLFSSGAGSWGSAGLAAYGAANRYLDRLAQVRREAGRTALSVAWGPWGGGGMMAADEAEQLAQIGLFPLVAEQALATLDELTTSGPPAAVVAAADWARFRRVFEARPRRKLFSSLSQAEPQAELAQVRLAVAALPSLQRLESVRATLRAQLARILQVAPDALPLDVKLVMLGLDSLGAIDLEQAALRELGVRLPVELLIGGADLQQVTEAANAQLEQLVVPEAAEPTAPATSALPTSYGQRAIWYLQQIAPESAAYNLAFAAWLPRDVELGVLRAAAQCLVDRHPVLRARFELEQGTLIQRIERQAEVDYQELSVSEQQANDVDTLIARHADEPFELSRPQLLRLRVCKAPDGRALLIATAHHIGVDFRSLAILRADLQRLYEEQRSGHVSQQEPTNELALRHAAREASELASAQGAEQLAFWLDELGGELPVLDLPTDFPRPSQQSWAGAVIESELEAQLSQAVVALARDVGATPYVAVLVAFQALLSVYGGQDDVIVGTPMTTVGEQEAGTVGNFVNAVPMRTRFSRESSFRGLVAAQAERVRAAMTRRNVPFPLLVERLRLARDPGRPPLHQVSFVWLNEASEPPAAGLPLQTVFQGQRGSTHDLTLTVFQRANSFGLRLTYCTSLFQPSTMRRMLANFQHLLTAMVRAPDQPVAGLSLLTEQDRSQLALWNRTDRDYSEQRERDGKLLHAAFLRRATEEPLAVAVELDGQQLSYGQLKERAEDLASRLAAAGVGPRHVIGVCMERSPELLVALYGVLLAGAAYLPLDPAEPVERVRYMLDDANVALTLRQQHLGTHAALAGRRSLALERDGSTRDVEFSAQRSPTPAAPSDLAYVIYTSGSTGRPKGVMIEHRAIRNRLLWMQERYALTSRDRVLHKTPIGFDVSVWELFWPLACGARLVLAAPGEHRVASELAERIARSKITTVHFVPSMLRAFLDEAPPHSWHGVKRVLCSGEALEPDLRDLFFQRADAELHNLYGPTEAAVDVTHWQCAVTDGEERTVPLGRPVANTQIHVLDANRRPLPIGVAGELAIGGVQVARGYLAKPELTQERFVEDPFVPGGRLYLTGDRGRYRADGLIEYLGRLDHQVKVRGVRVELGELEAVLASHADVMHCCALAKRLPSTDNQLVAFVVYRTGALSTHGDLRAYLAQRLPAAMVPARFVTLETMPLTSSGKVDRKQLVARADEASTAAAEGRELDATERELLRVCRGLLGHEAVTIDDDFFAVGGHSLIITQFCARIEATFGVRLAPRTVFATPNLGELAAHVRRGSASVEPPIEPVARGTDFPLSSSQRNLWLLHQLDRSGHAYNSPALLRLTGPLDVAQLRRALRALFAKHEIFRSAFPSVLGEPVQRLQPHLEPLLELVELSQEQAARELVRQYARQRFDLAVAPLVRLLLIRLAPDQHLLAVTLHHIISDGGSVGRMLSELASLYQDACAERALSSTPPALQYVDYAVWEAAHVSEQAVAADVSYWAAELAGAPTSLGWPARLRAEPGRPAGATRHELMLDEALVSAIDQRCQSAQVTKFTLLVAAFARALHELTARDDLVIGTVSAQRDRPELTDMLGCFINFLPLRLRGLSALTDDTLLQEARRVVFDGLAHARCPYDRIVDAQRAQGRRAGSSLYDVALLWQGFEGWAEHADLAFGPGVRASLEAVPSEVALLDLRVVAEPSGDSIRVTFEYRTDLLSEQAVTELAHRFAAWLERLTATEAADASRERRIEQAVCSLLGLASLDWERDFFSAGARRSQADAIARACSDALSMVVSSEQVAAHASVRRLAASTLESELLSELDASFLADLDALSDDEVARLLAGEGARAEVRHD